MHPLTEDAARADVIYRRETHTHVVRHIAAHDGMTRADAGGCEIERFIIAVAPVHSVIAEAG